MMRVRSGSRTALATTVACAALLVLAACGDDAADPSADGSTAMDPSAQASDDDTVDEDTFEQPGIGTDASVGDFCAAMEQVSTSIDDAQPGNDDDWLAIVAAFDHLYEVGTPKDLPADARTELDGVDVAVRQSNSVEEFNKALDANPPTTNAVDPWLKANCS